MPIIVEIKGVDVLRHIQQGTEELPYQIQRGIEDFGKIMETEHRREIGRVFVDKQRAILETKWVKSRDGGYLKTSEGAYLQDSSKDHWVNIADKRRNVHAWALKYGASYIQDIASGKRKQKSVFMRMRRAWTDAPFSRGLFAFDELMKKRVDNAFRRV